MEDFNKLDKHLNKVAQENEQTPPAFIWNEIDKQLPKKDDRKKAIWFWLFGIGFLVVGAGFYFLTGFNQEAEGAKITEAYELELAQESKQKATSNDLNPSVPKDLNKSSTSHSKESQATTEDSRDRTETKTDLINNTKRTNLSSTVMNDSSPGRNNLVVKSENHEGISISDRTTRRKDNMVHSKTKVAKYNATVISGQVLDDYSSSILKQSQSPILVADDSAEQLNTDPVARLLLEDVHPLSSLLTYPSVGESVTCNLPLSGLEEKKRSKLFLDLNVLAGLHDTAVGTDSLFSYRAPTESVWYTWGASAQLGYHFSDHLYLKSGIEYLESSNKFYFSIADVYLIQFDSTSVHSSRSERGTYYSRGEQTYKQLNIPLSIGVELQHGRLRWGGEATALFNFRFRSEGKFLAAAKRLSRIEEAGVYKNSLGLGLRAALMVGYDLGSKSTLYLKPTFSKYLSNTNKEMQAHSELIQYYAEVSYRLRF